MIGAVQDEVAIFLLQPARDPPLQRVLELDGGSPRVEPPGTRRARWRRAAAAGARVNGAVRPGDRGIRDLAAAAGAGIDAAGLPQTMQRGVVRIIAGALVRDSPVPVEAEGLERA